MPISTDTKDRLLQAAEELIAEGGFARCSMRNITTRAGVNLSAVKYHFGDKEGLIKAVVRNRLQSLNEERIRRLDEAMQSAGEIAAIIEAFVAPALELSQDTVGGGAALYPCAGACLHGSHGVSSGICARAISRCH